MLAQATGCHPNAQRLDVLDGGAMVVVGAGQILGKVILQNDFRRFDRPFRHHVGQKKKHHWHNQRDSVVYQ